MMIKSYRPYTPSRRFIQVVDFSDITEKKPCKQLTRGLIKRGGRGNTGRITVRHQGGGSKRLYREIDFKRDKFGVQGKIVTIEYDPNRSANICLVSYRDGSKGYILHPVGLKVGDLIESGPDVEIKTGNALPLSKIPLGTFVHAIELMPGKGAKLVRSAGGRSQVIALEGKYSTLRMPSGEVRMISKDSLATIGQVGNIEANTITIGNAGRQRHMGIRPTVRGTAMNSVDHPLGGGRGKSKGGNHPVSPWNQKAKGLKTRRLKSWSRLVVQDRKHGKALVVTGKKEVKQETDSEIGGI
ncbi:50S ribosomal protein L2 [Elusimicrobiota bacterium]